MSHTLQWLDDQILLVSFSPEFDFACDIPTMMGDVLSALDSSPSDLYIIADVSNVAPDLEGIIRGANHVRTASHQAFMRHERLIQALVVTSSRLMQLSTKGLNSATFGHVVLPIFNTLDEALAYARQQLDAASRAA